jgi:hypothetical protein
VATDGSGPDIDLLLASLRAGAADAHLFLQALDAKLEGALPGQVTVERHGGLFSRAHPVKTIALELGEHRYRIAEAGHGRPRAQRTRVVRGIALKTDELSVEEWLSSLAHELSDLAQSSERAREALERLLLGR